MHHDRARTYGRIAAGVVVIWVLIVGAITGIGKLIMITHNGNGNLLGDHTIPHWFAAQRTATLNHWSLIVSNLGATQDILIVSVAACVVFVAVTRRWRPVIFLAVVMFGELAAFLTVAAIVKRPRPDVPHLDSNLPTSAFPSGHMAATTCLYVGIAILVIGHARGWWRYLFLIPAIVMPVADRPGPHVPGRASPHRHPGQRAVRRALADRHHDADQAERRRPRPRAAAGRWACPAARRPTAAGKPRPQPVSCRSVCSVW